MASTASPASFLVTSRRAARRSTSSALLTLSATESSGGTAGPTVRHSTEPNQRVARIAARHAGDGRDRRTDFLTAAPQDARDLTEQGLLLAVVDHAFRLALGPDDRAGIADMDLRGDADDALDMVRQLLRRRAGLGLVGAERHSPGYGSWELRGQEGLLALLPHDELGIRLGAGQPAASVGDARPPGNDAGDQSS